MRGEYAAIHTAIVDDPDFKALSPDAKTVFYTLRMMLGASGIDLVRASRPVLLDVTGLEPNDLDGALGELVRGHWLIVQGDVLWIRNALRHNPNMNLSNENHRKAIVKHLAGLPKCEIVNAFAVYYDLDRPFPDIPSEWDTPSPPNGIPDPDNGHRTPDTHTGGTTTTAAAPPAQGEPSKVEVPDIGDAEILDVAQHVLGLNRLNALDLSTNKRILLHWLYNEGRDRLEVLSAIEGAADMRDHDLIGWPSATPGTPMTLKALNGPVTLADQGDGKAQRPLYDVAHEHQRAKDLGQPTKRRRPGSGPVPLSDLMSA